jgi:hypothetical protein
VAKQPKTIKAQVRETIPNLGFRNKKRKIEILGSQGPIALEAGA